MPDPLPKSIQYLIESAPCRLGLAVVDLKGGRRLSHNGDQVFAQASAIKIPIVWELNRAARAGEYSLQDTVAIDPADGAGGCGVLQNFSAGSTRMALGDLAVMMIVLSDNVATNLLIDRVTIDKVNRILEEIPTEQTRLRRKMMDLAARRSGRENTSTPEEAARAMATLYERAGRGDLTANSVLKTLRLRKESPVTAALPPGASLANKPGQLDGLRTDWAIIEQGSAAYAMTLMADNSDDDKTLKRLFSDLTSAIHQEMTGGI